MILVLATFLRLYRLDELMPFIGDQALFYLPAKDILTKGVIPLVGPETSHPWIHHGAHWTYVLAIILWIFKFNPVPPAYFIAILGVLALWLLYKVATELFTKRVGLIAAFLFATSPLIVLNSRMPYHTSPIPFFVLLLFYSVYKWVSGNIYFFPLITILIAVLYNHELTTFVFSIPIFLLIVYGFWKKKKWAVELLDKRVIGFSILLFLVPMIPFILYDIGHGYKQTVGFLVWVLYRLVKFPLNFLSPDNNSFYSVNSLVEFSSYLQQLIFPQSLVISLLILGVSACYLIYLLIFYSSSEGVPSGTPESRSLSSRPASRQGGQARTINYKTGYVLLFLYLVIPIVGLFAHRIPIEADILLISPFIVIVIAVLLNKLFSFKLLKFPVAFGVGMIIFFNANSLLSTDYLTKIGDGSRISFRERLEAVDTVLKIAGGKQYNLVGRGELSDFPMFTMNYEYLLWWKGQPPTKEATNLKIVVWEKEGEIIVYEEK